MFGEGVGRFRGREGKVFVRTRRHGVRRHGERAWAADVNIRYYGSAQRRAPNASNGRA